MSIIQKACSAAKVEVTGDALPKGQRTVKVFQRLISAMRSAESEVMDRLAQSERELNEALQQNLTLQEQVHRLEGQLLAFRLKEKLDEIDSLASVDRTKLLQVAPSVSAA